ncbi:MAG: hypothetical protein JAY74_22405, partial [Candidatus Thiodiazotropha taylori]|nr:hypothetical protein [Candidatus Thiodiazotropha taylori]
CTFVSFLMFHVMYSEVCSLEFALIIFCVFSSLLRNMAAGFGRGYSLGTRGSRGSNTGTIPRYSRHDKNFFAVLGEDLIQNGDNKFDMFTCASDTDDDFIPVRGKQSKRPRVSSSDQSGSFSQPQLNAEENCDYDLMSNEEKLTLILSKVSVNESRVSLIQTKLDSVLNINSRVSAIENVVKSQNDRLKLLEYRSLDIEARSRRRNLLFKGITENRRENCFEVIRDFMRLHLRIDTDMYLERAHRLGRFSINKTRPIIVAFRDFCDTEDILRATSVLKGSNYGVSRDYPNEIAKARQSLWIQFKDLRGNNPNKKVSLGYPAKIVIDGDTVVDKFPDWFPVLNGSRVSCTPCNQNQSSRQDMNAVETGSTTCTGRESPVINARAIIVNGSDTRNNNNQCVLNTVSPHENVPSTENNEMQIDEPCSPSIIATASVIEQTVAASAETSDDKRQSRGRSATRKA